MEGYWKTGAEANAQGMVYLAPNGIRNAINKRFWKATPACCDVLETGEDDSSYLLGLINEV
jgi:polyhydroxybutyrate depolymerase